MNAVETWAKDKDPILAIFAPQLAAFTLDLPDIFRCHKNRKFHDGSVHLPRLTSWYALYRNHNRYCESLLLELVEVSALAAHLTFLGAALQDSTPRKSDAPPPTEDAQRTARQFWLHLKELSLANLRADFEERRLDGATQTAVEHCLQHFEMELLFLFWVFLPCFILYQTTPTRLYRTARLGNSKAIDTLLRLDPLMLHDPAIGQVMQRLRLSGKHAAYQNLVEAPLKPIKATPTPNKLKTSMAALISIIATDIGHPLTAKEIKQLFDAIAKDADRAERDHALPQSPETLGKAMQRKRPAWEKLKKPDSKT